MADKIISQSMINKIWKHSKKDNKPALLYMSDERGFTDEMNSHGSSKIGYIDYLKLEDNFFLKDVIVFPLFGADGKIKGVNTRKLYEKFFIRFVSSNYPIMFTDYMFYKRTAVLVESPICALTLRPFLPDMSVCATLSAAMTEQKLTLLSTAKKIITVLDNDDIGSKGSDQIESYNPNTYQVPFHLFEGKKDPNDLFLNDRASFNRLVKYIKTIEGKTS